MDIIQFISKHLGEHKRSGKEIVVKTCPFCGQAKNKFYVNSEKLIYQCFSGSCRETGRVEKLYKKFNVECNLQSTVKEESLAKHLAKTSNSTIAFLKSRGISGKTIKANCFDVMSSKNDETAFVYRKRFDVNFIKFRGNKDKTFRAVKKKEITLWKLDFADTEKPLLICEGEIDQLTFEEQGIKNTVSVPAGASSLNWIDTDYNELEQFKEIILCMDSDKAGKEAVEKILKRLPEETIIKIVDLSPYKDANEAHLASVQLQGYIDVAQEYKEDFYVKMSEIDSSAEIERISTGSLHLNRVIGGLRFGEVTLWTGQAGSGKSTFLNQMLINTLEKGIKGWVYSPELTDRQYKAWVCKQMAPKDANGAFTIKFNEVMKQNLYFLNPELEQEMGKWLDEKFQFVTYGKIMSSSEILNSIRKACKKNGSRFFIIDNLMKIDFGDGVDLLDKQKTFLNRLSELAKTFNVSINLVAHPKKHDTDEPDQYDIAGSSNIPNLVDNIYYFKRITDKSRKALSKEQVQAIDEHEYSVMFMVLKSRHGEHVGEWEFFNFDCLRKLLYRHEEGIKFNTKWQTEEADDEFFAIFKD